MSHLDIAGLYLLVLVQPDYLVETLPGLDVDVHHLKAGQGDGVALGQSDDGDEEVGVGNDDGDYYYDAYDDDDD